ncbi:MAG: exodeoxyribonuclease VII large subunit [Candidatus Kapabacteria bacterium]|nr:exodeoxyribonuclease VII large subunit [Candidatus Kapabacteria bacterium]MDW8012715.1 exodeoxyribonuclease VII large subunit [Bacteroidota bacterium]
MAIEIPTLSVGELTRQLQLLLEESFPYVRVRGEISNYKLHSSGHRYFTLKDETAQIACVLWRSRVLSFEPQDGMRVIAEGAITVRPQRGQYQLDCWSLRPDGIGSLYEAFERLKQELQARGWFAEERKRPLPRLILRIGIATSPSGAALHDMLTTLRRRMPAATVYFRPTLVQGEGAPADIAQAIADLNQTDAQVIIVGRGGGSLEDLWAFNTIEVAEAIYSSRIPVVSAVGHEVDYTIADFVADVRAPTPTAAAELVSQFGQQALLEWLDQSEQRLWKAASRALELGRTRLQWLSDHPAFRRFQERIHLAMQDVDELSERLARAVERGLQQARHRLAALEAHCQSLYPLAPLRRGFALLRAHGRYIPPDTSLQGLSRVEIIRLHERAFARLTHVLPLESDSVPSTVPTDGNSYEREQLSLL